MDEQAYAQTRRRYATLLGLTNTQAHLVMLILSTSIASLSPASDSFEMRAASFANTLEHFEHMAFSQDFRKDAPLTVILIPPAMIIDAAQRLRNFIPIPLNVSGALAVTIATLSISRSARLNTPASLLMSYALSIIDSSEDLRELWQPNIN